MGVAITRSTCDSNNAYKTRPPIAATVANPANSTSWAPRRSWNPLADEVRFT
jgi:hypothetical protein